MLLTRVPLQLADRAHRHAGTTSFALSDLLAAALEHYLDEVEQPPLPVPRDGD